MTQQAGRHIPSSSVSSSSSCLYVRRHRQHRHFAFNKFMYRQLYRKLRQWDTGFILYHNPLEDPDSSYLSFSNPNYCMEDGISWDTGPHSPREEDDPDSLSLDKLSFTDGAPITHGAQSTPRHDHSDYSSAEITPSTPDYSFPIHHQHHLHPLPHPHDDTEDDTTSSLSDDSKDDEDDDNDDRNIEAMKQNGLFSKSESEMGEEEGVDGGERAQASTFPHQTAEGVGVGGMGGRPPGASRGILGYLAMLEQQASDGNNHIRGQLNDWRAGALSRENSAPLSIGKLEDGLGYINSPDSNDSGIHSDARSDDGGGVTPHHTPHDHPPSIARDSVEHGGEGRREENRKGSLAGERGVDVVGKKKKKKKLLPGYPKSADCVDTSHCPEDLDTPHCAGDLDTPHCAGDLDSPDSVYEEVAVIREEEEKEGEITSTDPALPPGWQKCEDEDGAYYWHVKSGTIQRDPPPPAPPEGPSLPTLAIHTPPLRPSLPFRSFSLNSDTSSSAGGSSCSLVSTPSSVTSSSTERHLQEFEGHALQYAARSLQTLVKPAFEARTYGTTNSEEGTSESVSRVGPSDSPSTVRFSVRSLGWVRIAEEDLNPERSSRAVNKCIVDLSLGRHDLNDAVGRWGDGKELYMDIDCRSLRLMDPIDTTLLNSQPIHSIRVWGVGRDNGRDFAYVARDRVTRVHMCHVFQCDTPARQIAQTLQSMCQHILQQQQQEQLHHRDTLLHDQLGSANENGDWDPLSLCRLAPRPSPLTCPHTIDMTFPTPMEEPRKNIRCHYLGCQEVIRPTGMDMVNESVDWMYYKVPPDKWTFVNVAIAPSTITITQHGNADSIIEECRVRFLSFMGISIASVKLCAFIMHTAQNRFMSHVFHCEPSAGPLCKTIEAACKLRYQKCLDAHPQTSKAVKNGKSVSSVMCPSLLSHLRA